MQKLNIYLIGIILLILVPINAAFSQDKAEIVKFFNDQSAFLLQMAHKNSSLISSEVKVLDVDDSEFDYKVIVEINYKGFIKNHKLDCFIYIKDLPGRFIWGIDSNSFEFNTKETTALEELKKKWDNYKF